MKFIGYVYKISNSENKKLYIGQTTNTVRKRWRDHISASKQKDTKGVILYDAMKEYGIDKFYVSSLETVRADSFDELKNQLKKREIYYISKYNTVRPYGYNCTIGGDSVSDFAKRKVVQYSVVGEFISSFDSVADACKSIGDVHSDNSIHSVCRGERKTAFGYVWRYEGDSFDLFDAKHEDHSKRVCQYDKYGNLIATYISISEAARTLGKFNSNGKPKASPISECCHGNETSVYGYIWRFEGDPFDKYNPQKYHYTRKISVCDKDMNVIETMRCAKDVCSKYNVSLTSIYKSIKRKCICKNYIFCYADN